MSNQEHPEGGSTPQPPVEAPVFNGAARRRFSKAGAVAVGAVLTLKSQPGMATNTSNCVFATPSAAGSFAVNRSRSPRIASCSAQKPSYWAANKGKWPIVPKTYPDKNLWGKSMAELPFQAWFSCAYGSTLYNQKLGTVIGWSGTDLKNVASCLIAANLNALNGFTTPHVTTATVSDIWKGYISPSGYTPIKPKGRTWTATDITKYIKGTWGEGNLWT